MQKLKETERCRIVANKQLNSSVFALEIYSKRLSQTIVPGQFVMIRCGEGIDAYLRRPLSVCSADLAKNTLTILYQVKGVGTNMLSRYRADQLLDVLGPLGNGFQLERLNENENMRKENERKENRSRPRVAILGGGIGVFPVYFLAQTIQTAQLADIDIYLGFRDKESVLLAEEFEKYAASFSLMTEDGTAGGKGFVTEPFRNYCEIAHKKESAYQTVFACGPEPMLKSIQNICKTYELNGQISLEQRMGCGIGACLVCACAIKTKGDSAGQGESNEQVDFLYKHVCKDGPVFQMSEVIF